MRNHFIKWVGILVLILTTNVRAEDFKALLELYRSYEMPEPTADAPLVQFVEDWRINSDAAPNYYQLGFQLSEDGAPSGHGPKILEGAELNEGYYCLEEYQIIKPDDVKVDRLAWASLATAIQCYSRGWTDLADRLLERIVKHQDAHEWAARPPHKEPLVRDLVIRMIWRHQLDDLLQAKSDRLAISKRMHRLLDEEKWFANDSKIGLLKSLDAANFPGKGVPGSIEEMIDKLVDFHTGDSDDFYNDPNYRDLALRGFEAIPVLIEHANDERLTRSQYRGILMGSPLDDEVLYFRVADVVRILLAELSGGELQPAWVPELKKHRIAQQPARDWFEKVKNQSEIDFALDHLTVKKAGSTFDDINAAWSRIVFARYPDRFDEAVRRVIDNPKSNNFSELFDLMLESDMPQKAKLELLDQAVLSDNFHTKMTALHTMKKLDPERAIDKLVDVLDHFSTKPTYESFHNSASMFVSSACQWGDVRACDAVEKVVARAEPALRVELFENWGFPWGADKRQLMLLVRYLDDTSSYEFKPTGDMPGLGPRGFEKITVGNFAALMIEDYVKWHDESGRQMNGSGEMSFGYGNEDDPRKSWTAEEWKAFREKMRASAEVRLKLLTK